jgi:hypothetical protein
MNQRLAIVIFAFAFVVAIVAGFFSPKGEEKVAPEVFRAKIRDKLAPAKPSPLVSPSAAAGASARNSEKSTPSRTLASESEPLTREAFLNKYGEDLSFTEDRHRIIRVDGTQSKNSDNARKVKGFQSSRSEDLAKRGREVLNDARSLLGISDATEWNDPLTTPGDSTGQVIFQQASGGVPVYPGGTVTILLGPSGEVITLDSSIYSAVQIINARTVLQPGRSRTLLFIDEVLENGSKTTAVARYGYETLVKGIQTIIDAQTGGVIYERNKQVR